MRVVADGRPLWMNPLHLRTLAHLELLTRAATHLTFLTVHVLSLTEHSASSFSPEEYDIKVHHSSAPKLLRLLTPLTKAVTARLCLQVIPECVEALGGIGYLENEEPMNLVRLLRDAQVLSIWEGTTNVLLTDLVASLKRTRHTGGEERDFHLLREWVEENLGGGNNARGSTAEAIEECKLRLWSEWQVLEKILARRSKEELTAAGRRVMGHLGWVVCGTLLLVDARRDGERGAAEIVRRWVLEGEGWGEGKKEWKAEPDWERVKRDTWIVYGEDVEGGGSEKPRL